MAKVSLARKKELKEPDAFLDTSNQVAQFIQENKQKVVGGITAFLLIIVSISGYIAYSDYHNKKAFTEFAKDLTWYEGTDATAEKPSLKDVKERSDAFFSKYSGTVAGTLARSKYAGIFYAEGNYKDAVKLYERLAKDVKSDSALKNIALSGLAYTYEAMGQDDDAIKTFEMISNGVSDVKKADALFHLGMLYSKKNNNDKSMKAFETIVSSHSESVYIDIAKEKTAK